MRTVEREFRLMNDDLSPPTETGFELNLELVNFFLSNVSFILSTVNLDRMV